MVNLKKSLSEIVRKVSHIFKMLPLTKPNFWTLKFVFWVDLVWNEYKALLRAHDKCFGGFVSQSFYLGKSKIFKDVKSIPSKMLEISKERLCLLFFCYLKIARIMGKRKIIITLVKFITSVLKKVETKKSDSRWLSQLSRKGSQGLHSLKPSLQVSNETSKP